jgi:glycosyltransferase involved in cell wall biosynthesis
VTERLRVLHVGKFYYPYRGGMETHLSTLCERLAPHLALHVVVANTSRARTDEVLNGVAVTRLGTAVNLGAAPYTPGLAGFIRASEADIVHLHWPHPTAVLSYLRSGHTGRLIVTYHSDIVRQRVLGFAFRPFLHAVLRRASAIICTSPDYIASSSVLRRHRGRCHVLPFSIAVDAFASAQPSAVAEVRGAFGPRIILAIGRMVSYKGFEYLIRAMRSVNARLLIIGDGPLRQALEHTTREAGVADRVTMLAKVTDVAPFLHAADVFVLPSIARSEAFGIVQLEAMAAGTPVVNTALASGVPYVSPHGVSGLTVPPGDSAALAAAMNLLLDDPQARARYGAAGQQRVRTHFNVDAMASRTMDLYRAVMTLPPGTPIAAGGENASR